MPFVIEEKTGAPQYQEPFIEDSLTGSLHVKVDVSTLTVAEVDRFGKIRPGTPLGEDGKRLTGVVGEYVRGVVPEAAQLVAANPTNATLAANTSDPFVGVGVIGVVDRDAVEANLGRVLSAEELAGFAHAKCKLVLSRY
ncbi:MAG: hypothetical protein KY445_08530 [Armatimonadetes bacterium]|nr:hypothetical protein [Armatimonadota bacterium]